MDNTSNTDAPSEKKASSAINTSDSRSVSDKRHALSLVRGRRSAALSQGGRYRLDNLEKLIITELRQDGRKSFQAIARELGVDEKTVRNRVGKLREMGILNIIPTTEESRLRDCIVAIIAVNIVSDPEIRQSVQTVADEISKLPAVSWVGITMGTYDLFVEVIVDSIESMSEFQYNMLPSIAGVERTDSFLVLSHYGRRGVPFVQSILELEE